MTIQHTHTPWRVGGEVTSNQEGLYEIWAKDCTVPIATVQPSDPYKGFLSRTKANAALICDAVNNTAGKGIDPNAVPGLLYIVSELVKKSFRKEGASKYTDYSVASSLIDKAKEAIKSAELK